MFFSWLNGTNLKRDCKNKNTGKPGMTALHLVSNGDSNVFEQNSSQSLLVCALKSSISNRFGDHNFKFL